MKKSSVKLTKKEIKQNKERNSLLLKFVEYYPKSIFKHKKLNKIFPDKYDNGYIKKAQVVGIIEQAFSPDIEKEQLKLLYDKYLDPKDESKFIYKAMIEKMQAFIDSKKTL